MSEKKDSKKEKLKNLKKADERLKKREETRRKEKEEKGVWQEDCHRSSGSSCRYSWQWAMWRGPSTIKINFIPVQKLTGYPVVEKQLQR